MMIEFDLVLATLPSIVAGIVFGRELLNRRRAIESFRRVEPRLRERIGALCDVRPIDLRFDTPLAAESGLPSSTPHGVAAISGELGLALGSDQLSRVRTYGDLVRAVCPPSHPIAFGDRRASAFLPVAT